MNLPPPTPSNKPRKQLRQSKKQAYQRLAVIQMPKNVPVTISTAGEWALRTPDIETVKSIVDAYPLALTESFLASRSVKTKRGRVNPADYDYDFVIPKALMTKLESAVADEGMKQDRVQHLHARSAGKYGDEERATEQADGDDEILLSISPDLAWFSR